MSIRPLALGLLVRFSSWTVMAGNWRKGVSEVEVRVPWAPSFQEATDLQGYEHKVSFSDRRQPFVSMN